MDQMHWKLLFLLHVSHHPRNQEGRLLTCFDYLTVVCIAAWSDLISTLLFVNNDYQTK